MNVRTWVRMPLGLAALALGALQPADAADFRWTGGGADAYWSTVGNWEVDNDGWQAAATPPGSGDVVYLGDAAADEPQEVVLDGDVTIYRLFMQATGNRDYILSSLLDGGGGEYTLTLTAAFWTSVIEQSTTATCDLTFRAPVDLSAIGTTSIYMLLLSTSHARLIIERPFILTPNLSGKMVYLRGKTSAPAGPAVGGILELRSTMLVTRFDINYAGVVLLNYDGPGNVISGYFGLATHSSVWVQKSATTGNGLWFADSTAIIRAYEAGSEERTLWCNGSVTRNGTYHVGPSLPESSGRFVLTITALDVGADMALMPRFHLATNTVLNIRRRQMAPMNQGNQNIIYGPGALAKLDTAWPVTGIGATNTYTGGTFVEAGTIQLAGGFLFQEPEIYVEGQIGPGLLSVATGATFDLNGIGQTISALHGAGTVQLAGATLTATNGVSPGTNSIGTLTVAGAGALDVSGSRSLFEFSADTNVFDRVVFSGAADLQLGGALEIAAPEGFSEYGAGRYMIFDLNGGAVGGSFAQVKPPAGMTAELDGSGGDLFLVLAKRPTGTLLLLK